MTSLKDQLIARIVQDGPISLAEYMTECLLHPTFGYYSTRDPLGAAGDFTTAPEISQMFGELVGLALAQAWLDQGSPSPFVLAEAGPGRGTLMADMLRATRHVPGFEEAAQIHLIEASRTLRNVQQKTLGRTDITWHDAADTLPDLPIFVVANEFFDALPIHQYQRADNCWRERQVGVRDGELTIGLSGAVTPAQLAQRVEDTNHGQVVEVSPPAISIARMLGQKIVDYGGTAIIIDYGDWRSLGDTFQALRDHAPVDPLHDPGLADLTAHVDFEALARATPSHHSRLTPQGVFLERLGITERANVLAASLSGDALKNHVSAHRRLTHPQEMGTLFKVLAFFPDGAMPPPGLEP